MSWGPHRGRAITAQGSSVDVMRVMRGARPGFSLVLCLLSIGCVCPRLSAHQEVGPAATMTRHSEVVWKGAVALAFPQEEALSGIVAQVAARLLLGCPGGSVRIEVGGEPLPIREGWAIDFEATSGHERRLDSVRVVLGSEKARLERVRWDGPGPGSEVPDRDLLSAECDLDEVQPLVDTCSVLPTISCQRTALEGWRLPIPVTTRDYGLLVRVIDPAGTTKWERAWSGYLGDDPPSEALLGFIVERAMSSMQSIGRWTRLASERWRTCHFTDAFCRLAGAAAQDGRRPADWVLYLDVLQSFGNEGAIESLRVVSRRWPEMTNEVTRLTESHDTLLKGPPQPPVLPGR